MAQPRPNLPAGGYPQAGAPLPAPAEVGKVLSSWDGLKNTLQPERLSDKDLVRARNVVLDDTGQPSRRRGYALKLPGNVHSLFTTYQGIVLGVVNSELSIIHPDYSYQPLAFIGTDHASGMSPLVYSQVGDQVYYVSPVDRGIVNVPNRSWGPWGDPTDLWLSPVVNPTETLPEIAGRLLKQPPHATCMTYYNGRLYLGAGPTLWATELYLYNFVDATAGYKLFEADITLLGSVTDGVYVGTKESLWFLTGPTFAEMKRTWVMGAGVIPGSMVDVPGELANPPQVPITAMSTASGSARPRKPGTSSGPAYASTSVLSDSTLAVLDTPWKTTMRNVYQRVRNAVPRSIARPGLMCRRVDSSPSTAVASQPR